MQYSSIPPMTAPRITIHIASVNFAFSGPTNALPASHTKNEFTIMLITTAISKYKMFDVSSANLNSPFVSLSNYVWFCI